MRESGIALNPPPVGAKTGRKDNMCDYIVRYEPFLAGQKYPTHYLLRITPLGAEWGKKENAQRFTEPDAIEMARALGGKSAGKSIEHI